MMNRIVIQYTFRLRDQGESVEFQGEAQAPCNIRYVAQAHTYGTLNFNWRSDDGDQSMKMGKSILIRMLNKKISKNQKLW